MIRRSFFYLLLLSILTSVLVFDSCDQTEDEGLENNAPTAPLLVYPTDNLKTVDPFDSLLWNRSTDPDGDAVKYNVYLDTESKPGTVVATRIKTDHFSPDLKPNTNYYWKVESDDGNGGLNSSAIWSFVTSNKDPEAVVLTYPGNESGDIPLDARLTWIAVEDPEGTPILYDVYFGLESSPVTIVSEGQTQLSFLPELTANTVYYWKIVAKDADGGSSESDIWSFTTIDDSPVNIEYGSFEDSRDDKVYQTIDIGDQIWMAENLAYLPSVGDSIKVYGYTGTDVSEAKSTDNYDVYGALYTWETAMNGEEASNDLPSGVRGVCPSGWHLPSRQEWNQLLYFIESEGNTATGTVLKSRSGWEFEGNGIDKYGFGGKPAGQFYNGEYSQLGLYTWFWSSAKYYESGGELTSWYKSLSYQGEYMGQGVAYVTRYWFSVRCVKD